MFLGDGNTVLPKVVLLRKYTLCLIHYRSIADGESKLNKFQNDIVRTTLSEV